MMLSAAAMLDGRGGGGSQLMRLVSRTGEVYERLCGGLGVVIVRRYATEANRQRCRGRLEGAVRMGAATGRRARVSDRVTVCRGCAQANNYIVCVVYVVVIVELVSCCLVMAIKWIWKDGRSLELC